MGHRAFYWALDKSGSMDAPKKLGMLAISVMAGLYGIKKDVLGKDNALAAQHYLMAQADAEGLGTCIIGYAQAAPNCSKR